MVQTIFRNASFSFNLMPQVLLALGTAGLMAAAITNAYLGNTNLAWFVLVLAIVAAAKLHAEFVKENAFAAGFADGAFQALNFNQPKLQEQLAEINSLNVQLNALSETLNETKGRSQVEQDRLLLTLGQEILTANKRYTKFKLSALEQIEKLTRKIAYFETALSSSDEALATAIELSAKRCAELTDQFESAQGQVVQLHEQLANLAQVVHPAPTKNKSVVEKFFGAALGQSYVRPSNQELPLYV